MSIKFKNIRRKEPKHNKGKNGKGYPEKVLFANVSKHMVIQII